jgi:hypothetical protein
MLTTEQPTKECATPKEMATRLHGVGWDFKKAVANRRSIHSFHSYPARFIPEIPRAVIQELKPAPNTLVFDPFCGCGTTLVEAQLAGYASCGVDLNPIGCLISRVKTTALPPNFLITARKCIERAMENPIARQGLDAAFSSIIVRVSNQDSDTRYAAVLKVLSKEHVFETFEEAINNLANVALTLPNIIDAPATVINRSIFEVKSEDIPGEIGLVITSPPYPNAYEYWLYHKYRMWWLGFDPLCVNDDA